MKALILTEGGVSRGFGHVIRCAAIADELASRGVAVRFGLAGDEPARNFAAGTGLDFFPLDSWDASAVQSILDGEDLVVVDSYLAELPLYRSIAERSGRCLWIDDNRRLRYPRGFLLNSRPDSRTLFGESASDPGVEYLFGPSFHPLRPEFRVAHERRNRQVVEEILCVLGGSDPTSTTPLVVRSARRIFPEARIRAIVPRPDQRSSWATPAMPGVEFLEAQSAEGMRRMMEHADLAICAGGQTIQEGLRLGLPMVAIEIAPNQRGQMDAFVSEGAILDAGRHDQDSFPSRLEERLVESSSLERRLSLSAQGPRLIDGLGCRRIVGRVLGWTSELALRDARPEDSRRIWEIASDPSVRACSFNPAPISWESHESWYQRALASTDLLFLVVVDPDGVVSGYIRAHREGSASLLSIALHRDLRGRGEGGRLLREGCAVAMRRHVGIGSLHAWIEATNEGSHRSFLAAGFLPSTRRETAGDRVFKLHVRSVPS